MRCRVAASPLACARVIFISQTSLGSGFNLQRICLRAVRGRDQIIMGCFCTAEPGGAFRNIVGQTGNLARLENLGRVLGTRQHHGGTINQARQA